MRDEGIFQSAHPGDLQPIDWREVPCLGAGAYLKARKAFAPFLERRRRGTREIVAAIIIGLDILTDRLFIRSSWSLQSFSAAQAVLWTCMFIGCLLLFKAAACLWFNRQDIADCGRELKHVEHWYGRDGIQGELDAYAAIVDWNRLAEAHNAFMRDGFHRAGPKRRLETVQAHRRLLRIREMTMEIVVDAQKTFRARFGHEWTAHMISP